MDTCCQMMKDNLAILWSAMGGPIRLKGGTSPAKMLSTARMWARAALEAESCPHCEGELDQDLRELFEKVSK